MRVTVPSRSAACAVPACRRSCEARNNGMGSAHVRRGCCEFLFPNMAVMVWLLCSALLSGRYTIGEARLPEMANKLCELAGRPDSTAVTKSYIVTALIKLTAQMGTCPPSTVALIERYGSSADTDLMQRCYEFGTFSW